MPPFRKRIKIEKPRKPSKAAAAMRKVESKDSKPKRRMGRKELKVPVDKGPIRPYEAILNDGARIRLELDTKLHREFNDLKEWFSLAVGVDKQEFKHAHDLLYYDHDMEGYADRVERLAYELQAGLYILGLVGKDGTLIERLRGYGLVVNKTRDRWKGWERSNVDHAFVVPSGVSRFITKQDRERLGRRWPEPAAVIMEIAQRLQSEICSKSDMIKIGLAAEAEAGHDVKKPNFVQAVKAEAERRRRGEDALIERLRKVIDQRKSEAKAMAPLVKVASGKGSREVREGMGDDTMLPTQMSSSQSDIIDALLSLGYDPMSIDRAMSGIDAGGLTQEELMSKVIGALANG